MIKILFTVFYADENMFYFNEDSGSAIFICNGMAILNINLHNINLIMMKMILISLFLSDFWLGILNLKNTKKLEKDKRILKDGGIFACLKMRKKK